MKNNLLVAIFFLFVNPTGLFSQVSDFNMIGLSVGGFSLSGDLGENSIDVERSLSIGIENEINIFKGFTIPISVDFLG